GWAGRVERVGGRRVAPVRTEDYRYGLAYPALPSLAAGEGRRVSFRLRNLGQARASSRSQYGESFARSRDLGRRSETEAHSPVEASRRNSRGNCLWCLNRN